MALFLSLRSNVAHRQQTVEPRPVIQSGAVSVVTDRPQALGVLSGRECGHARERRGGCIMEFSTPEAKARFAEAATAAARGERVVVTKHGRPIVELVSARQATGMDFERAAIIRRQLGLDGLTVTVPPNFDGPAFSRQVVGLER
jgi:prevent-host-death family protein